MLSEDVFDAVMDPFRHGKDPFKDDTAAGLACAFTQHLVPAGCECDTYTLRSALNRARRTPNVPHVAEWLCGERRLRAAVCVTNMADHWLLLVPLSIGMY